MNNFLDYENHNNQKKSYLDLFLENTTKKKRGIYFGEEQQKAIIKYNNPETSQAEKNKLFEETIGIAFKMTISGVLEMKKFRNLGKLNRDELIDATFFRMIEKIHRFKPDVASKKGGNAAAFSFFSTVAKNYILEMKLRNEKVLKNKADVETSIDLSILSEDTLQKMSNYDRHEVELDDYEHNLKNTKDIIIKSITEIIVAEEVKEKKDDDLIKLGYCLKYLVVKWDKIEFMKKNEFMRILTLYTGFPQQKVSFLFKRFKIDSLKKTKGSSLHKNKIKKSVKNTDDKDPAVEETDIPDGYQINSMEEFEQQLYRNDNKKYKDAGKNKNINIGPNNV